MPLLDDVLVPTRPPRHPLLHTAALVAGRLLLALLVTAVLVLAGVGVVAGRALLEAQGVL